MASSGNYLIGDGFSIPSFREHVEPVLNGKRIQVRDILDLGKRLDKEGNLLLSLLQLYQVEETPLRENLITSLEQVKKKVSQKYREKGLALSIYPHQLNVLKTIGEYSSINTASQQFSLIAQRYLTEIVSKEIEQVGEKIRTLFNQTIADLVK